MCGICGILAGKHERPNEQSILEMFAKTDSRGKDASGFASSCKGKIWSYKAPAPSSVIVHKLNEFKLRGAKSWIGHTRMATHGTHLKNINNHPFVKQGLALIHNGIVNNYDKVIFAGGYNELEGDCDSELILATITKYRQRLGVTGAIKQMAKELSGAMACALINRPGELWIWHREYARKWSMTPLMVAVSAETPNFHFASTRDILQTSLNPGLSWDVGSLDAGKGLHIKIVREKLQVIDFDVPDCEDKSYSFYDWDQWEDGAYDYELNKFDRMHRRALGNNPSLTERQIWCGKCHGFKSKDHLCDFTNTINLKDHLGTATLDPEEDALYYCETNKCNTLLTSEEIIAHANETNHMVYRKELM